MSERPIPRGRKTYRYFAAITTRWADNDAYGHVNNTVYYAWFDSVVNQWLIEASLLDVAIGDPIGLVVETGCRYLAPLTYPGTVDVGLAVERLGTSSVTYRLGVFGENRDEPAAEGHFTHVMVSRTDRRPVPLPETWRASLAGLT